MALQTNILVGNPKYNHQNDQHIKKRAYEMTAAELAGHNFNPTNDAEVLEAQQKIDDANSAKEAYYAFLSYTEGRDFTPQEINASIGQYVNNARQPLPYIINDNGERVDLTEGQRDQRLRENQNIENEHKFAKKDAKDLHDMLKKLAPGSVKDRIQKKYDDAMVKYNEAREKRKQIKKVQYDHKVGADVNVPLLKIKLKNMVRQVRDYPELKHRIGGLTVTWNEEKGSYRENPSQAVMSTFTTSNIRGEKAQLSYDAYHDRATPEGQKIRDKVNAGPDSIGHHLDYVGNHELGHAQASFLNETDDEHSNHQAESDILEATLQQVIPNDYANLPRVPVDAEEGIPGQIDTENSQVLTNHHLTSDYGQTQPSEWFAESFHDVYTKGADAKPASIAMVKEYEKRMTAKQKAGFKKKKRGWFSKIGRFFSRWRNFGARHAPQQPAVQNANPAAVVPQQNAANVNPVGNNAPLQMAGGNEVNQIDANQAPNLNPIAQIVNADPEDVLNTSMIVEAPKRKNLNKKKKKKGK